jgi:hypothetical protein
MAFELNKNIEWSSHLERYFKDLGEKSYCLSYLHKKAEASYAYYRNFIDLPVIILSTLAGTLSIGGVSFWGKENEASGSVAVGVVSLGVGIMNTVGTYFGFAKRCENHRLSHIQYAKLYRFLAIELSLPINERLSPSDLLKICRDNYERLQEISPIIPYKIIQDFKKQFNTGKYETIAKPSEANGLEAIYIYKENIKDVLNEVEDVVESQIVITENDIV